MSYPENISSPPVDARVACVDGGASPTTNKACPEPTSKLDDHGRGGFVIEAGKFYQDRSGRKRGPVDPEKTSAGSWIVDDEFGFITFLGDGSWIAKETPHNNYLIAPWIDWKAVAEEALELLHGVHSSGAMMYAPDKLTDEYHALCSKLPNLKGEGAGA